MDDLEYFLALKESIERDLASLTNKHFRLLQYIGQVSTHASHLASALERVKGQFATALQEFTQHALSIHSDLNSLDDTGPATPQLSPVKEVKLQIYTEYRKVETTDPKQAKWSYDEFERKVGKKWQQKRVNKKKMVLPRGSVLNSVNEK